MEKSEARGKEPRGPDDGPIIEDGEHLGSFLMGGWAAEREEEKACEDQECGNDEAYGG